MGKKLVVSIVGVCIKLRFVEFFPNETNKIGNISQLLIVEKYIDVE
jgi:hypothetical protein